MTFNHHHIDSFTDDDMVPCSTPLKVSLTGFSNGNGSTGYCTNNFSRSFSEPQEDEWCET